MQIISSNVFPIFLNSFLLFWLKVPLWFYLLATYFFFVSYCNAKYHLEGCRISRFIIVSSDYKFLPSLWKIPDQLPYHAIFFLLFIFTFDRSSTSFLLRAVTTFLKLGGAYDCQIFSLVSWFLTLIIHLCCILRMNQFDFLIDSYWSYL